MTPSLIDDALDPGVSQPVSPTQFVPRRRGCVRVPVYGTAEPLSVVDGNQTEQQLKLSKTGLKIDPSPLLTLSGKILPKNPEHDESNLRGAPELPCAFENNPSWTDLPDTSHLSPFPSSAPPLVFTRSPSPKTRLMPEESMLWPPTHPQRTRGHLDPSFGHNSRSVGHSKSALDPWDHDPLPTPNFQRAILLSEIRTDTDPEASHRHCGRVHRPRPRSLIHLRPLPDSQRSGFTDLTPHRSSQLQQQHQQQPTCRYALPPARSDPRPPAVLTATVMTALAKARVCGPRPPRCQRDASVGA